MSQLAYNVGLTEAELNLLIRLIDIDEDMTDADEDELAGIRRKLVHRRKQLRRRIRETNAGHQPEIIVQ